jgi:PAS domain S-box-containing protein
MDYKLEELTDISLLQDLQDKLNAIYSFPSAIVDNEGKVLTAVAWQDICTKFHRTHPLCEQECIKSDLYILEHLPEANPAVSYQCPHGLTDNAMPIIIDGRHVGNFFTGQFFLENPDPDFFRKQAAKYGFDETSYLEAVSKVPVISREKLMQYLDFIKSFLGIIAGIGLTRLKELEVHCIIKENEERYRAILQSTSDWIWEIDTQGRYNYSSDKVERILGYTPVEILGKSPFDFMPPEEQVRIGDIFKDIADRKTSIVDMENWNLHKDGHLVCLLTNGFPIMDDSGTILGYRGADKDITERKSVEEALKASESHYRNLMEKMPDGVYKSTHDGKFVDVNPAMVSMMGYDSKEELMSIDIKNELYFSPEDRESVPLRENLKEIGVYRMRKKDGSEIWVEDHGWLNFDESSNILYHEGVMMDVTERLKAEKILKENEKKYRNIFDNAQEGIFQTTLDGTYLSVNPALAKMYGFDSPEEMMDTRKDISKDAYYDSSQRTFFLELIEEQGFVKGYEYEVRHKDGHPIWFYEDAKAVRDEQGRLLYFEGFVVDITDRKRAEKELSRINETLEERITERTGQLEKTNKELAFHLNELEQFAYITNHDLQEPLRTLTHFAELIRDGYAGELDEDGNKYIDFIYRSAGRMKDLVTGLFNYSLLGKESALTVVNCNLIVDAVISDLGDSIKETNAHVTVNPLPTLNGYETELRLLFQNLVINAIKFSKTNVCPEITITAEDHEKEWTFYVTDNGIGIDKQYRHKIFIIFQRLHNRHEYEGTGIGLAHCKKIVELHGGRISVDSKPGEGSTFTFTIPKM